MASIDDFKKLQREYSYLEANRKQYAKTSTDTVSRQEKLLDKLRRDNEYLKTEYRNHIRKPRAASSQSKLISLQDQVDSFAAKVQTEKKTNEELADQLKLVRSKIRQTRRRMGGVNAAQENQRMIEKQIRILENRLEKALIKFNEALAHNKKLRGEIDNLRKERVVFDNLYRKMEGELQQKKRQMSNVIEASNKAYEARDALQAKVADLQRKDMREHKIFEEKMAKLDRRLMKRVETQSVEELNGGRGRMSIEEEEDLSHRVTKAAWILSKERANIQISKEKVQSYKEAFEQIRKYNGISDIDELVKEFIASEEHNFSLFNYVNSQTHELEKLEEEIENLKREQLAYGSEGGPGNDNSQHKQLQKDLRQSFEFINASIEQYDAKHQQVDNTISALKVAIQHIFNKIDCDVSNMSDMLADSQVTEANMMQYLGIIEQRTNEVLQLWALKDEAPNTAVSKDAEPARIASSIANAIGQGPSHPMGEQKVQITPPTMDEFAFDDEANSDDDDIQMPQTIDTIIAQIKSQMGKHNNHANGRRGYRRK